jgi:predicted nucleic acid-binding protein
MIVVDANVLAFYLIEGDRTVEANALREADPEWILPVFWSVEFQSIVWKYARFGGMPADRAVELLEQAMTLFSVNEVAPPPDLVLRDALRWGITVYDAQYASLARQMGIRCVTEDRPVQEACPTIAISLGDFLKGRSSGGAVRETRTPYRARRTLS